MSAASLAQYHANRVNKEMPRVLGKLRALGSHLRLLSALGGTKALEARDLLRCARDAREAAYDLKHSLTQMAEFRSSVGRRGLGERYGLFAANYQGLSRQISAEFELVERRAKDLEQGALARINEPGRWGDAAAGGAVAELSALLAQVLELWGLLLVKRKLSRQ
ncbi:hypothetical protein [Methylibium rhizosphaerae]|jgi:hypothetical protein|uniref:hypothetical protein n=1 Tax=Methylibium rhizosphaerae TaxID=2570323 RepID=UPI001125B99E|nr:hypothetical protein [Methylibium rhizosphaerae]